MLVVVKIGDRLRDLRVRRALTQEELAEKADVGTNTVARLERNESEPHMSTHMSTLRKLARALGVDPAELIGD
jgi:transcriptional regulator with XRE-family HTH domain